MKTQTTTAPVLAAALAKVEQRAVTPTSQTLSDAEAWHARNDMRALELQHKQPQTVEGFLL